MYFFYGSDTDKVRAKAFAWVAAAREKEPQIVYTRIAASDISEETLVEIEESGSLFVKRILVLIDDLFVKTNTVIDTEAQVKKDFKLLESHIDAIIASNNAIILLAPGLSTARAEKIAAKATKKYKFDKTISARARGFNNVLVNALAARDSSALWLEIMRARAAGDAPEMLHGLLHWKARDLMKKGGLIWTFSEARTLSLSLITLVVDTRRTGSDLTMALERFALSMH